MNELPMSALEPAGPQADRIGALWNLFLVVAVIVTVLVIGVELVGVVRAVRRRRREAFADPLARDPVGDRRRLHVIAVATAATVATLIGLLIASVETGKALAALGDRRPAEGQPLTIKITGHQWWWEVEYEHTVPALRVTTANELHLPVGRPVLLRLASSDVIHSLSIPSLHGKKDLIPGRENVTWIQADRAGVFRGQCAEFCGVQHARMALPVVAEAPAAFEAWLAHQRQPAPPPATEAARRGQAVFLTGACVMCHTIRGTDAGATAGPELTHLASRTSLAAGTLPNTRGHLLGWISDPQRIKPGVRMPPNPLPSADLDALLAYLETLR